MKPLEPMSPAARHARHAPSARGRDGLAETLARIARLGDGYELHVRPIAEGWSWAEELVHGGAGFERIIERLGGAPSADPTVRRAIGSQLVLHYLRFLWPVVAAFALERRIPDVAAANLLVRLDGEGWPSAFSLAQPRFAVLQADPAAVESSFVAHDEAELLGWLHERSIDANAAPLIEQIRKQLLTSGT